MFKTKTGAILLWLFLGDFGAHWFYLGEPRRGWFYPLGWLTVVICSLGGAATRIEGRAPGVITDLFTLGMGLAFVLLFISRWWDFFHLLAMHPEDFEREFNGRHVPWSW